MAKGIIEYASFVAYEEDSEEGVVREDTDIVGASFEVEDWQDGSGNWDFDKIVNWFFKQDDSMVQELEDDDMEVEVEKLIVTIDGNRVIISENPVYDF